MHYLDNKTRLCVLCVVVAIAFRLLILHAALSTLSQPGYLFGGDAVDYNKRALSLLRFHTFAVSPRTPDIPDAKRTPGYPLLVAAVYALAGENPVAVAAVQCVMSGLLAGLLFAFIAGRQSVGIAAICALLFALEPLNAIYSLALMTEAISALLTLVVSWLLIKSARQGSILLATAAGVLLGIATLVRPAFLVLAIAFAAFLAWAYRPDGIWRLRSMLSPVLAFIVAFSLPLTPWIIRNQNVFGVPRLTSISGIQLYYGNAAELLSRVAGVENTQEYRTGLADRVLAPTGMTAEYASLRQFAASDRLSTAAREVFCQHPYLAVWTALRAGSAMLTQPNREAYEVFPQGSPLRLLWLPGWGLWMLVVALAIVGLSALWKADTENKYIVLLSLIVIIVTTAVCGLVGSARYRITIEPMIYVLAAFGVHSLQAHPLRRPRPPAPHTADDARRC